MIDWATLWKDAGLPTCLSPPRWWAPRLQNRANYLNPLGPCSRSFAPYRREPSGLKWEHKWKTKSTRSAILISFPPSSSGISKAKTFGVEFKTRSFLFRGKNLVENRTRRDGDEIFSGRPSVCVCVWKHDMYRQDLKWRKGSKNESLTPCVFLGEAYVPGRLESQSAIVKTYPRKHFIKILH